MTTVPFEPRFTADITDSPIRMFSGLKSRWHYPDQRLIPGSLIDGYSVNFGESGFASRRLGYSKYNSTGYSASEADTGFIEASIGSYESLRVIVTPDAIFSDDRTTRTDITGSVTLSGGNDDHTRFAVIQDTLCATNGKDLWSWDGNIAGTAIEFAFNSGSGLTSFTTCVDLVEHNNLLVALSPTEGGTKKKSRIRWSDIDVQTFDGDIATWRDDNRAEIGEGGEPIIGGVDNWDKLWVIKEDGVYYGKIVYDNGFLSYVPEGVLRGFHPIATGSLYARPEFIIGVAYEGIFVIRPDGTVEIVTLGIQDIWNALNMGRLQYSIAAPREKDHQMRLLCSSSINVTGHNRVIAWDWETGDIAVNRYSDIMNHIGHYYNSGVEYDFLGRLSGLYSFQGNDGTTDNGAAYQYMILTVPDDCGLPGVSKIIKEIVIYYNEATEIQSVTLKCYRDQNLRGNRTTSKTLGQKNEYNTGLAYNSGLTYGGGANQKMIFSVNRTAENIQLEISGGNPLNLIGYQIKYMTDDNNSED